MPTWGPYLPLVNSQCTSPSAGFELGCELVDGPAVIRGVHIVNVKPGSPAHAAGLLQWDVVEGVDGVPVASLAELKAELGDKGFGVDVILTVHRGEPGNVSTLSVPLTLGVRGFDRGLIADAKRVARAEVKEGDWPGWGAPLSRGRASMCDAQPVARRVAKDYSEVEPVLGFGLVDGPEGVHVVHVRPGSPADEAGVFPYDVLESVNGVAVGSLQELKLLFSCVRPGDVLDLMIHRGPPGGVTRGEMLPLTVGAANASMAWVGRAHRVASGVVLKDDLGDWG